MTEQFARRLFVAKRDDGWVGGRSFGVDRRWASRTRVDPTAIRQNRTNVRGQSAATLEAEDQFDLARCPQIQAPTLIVGGSRDPFYTTQQFLETAALIRQSRVHIESRSGHMSVADSERVQAMIAGFSGA